MCACKALTTLHQPPSLSLAFRFFLNLERKVHRSCYMETLCIHGTAIIVSVFFFLFALTYLDSVLDFTLGLDAMAAHTPKKYTYHATQCEKRGDEVPCDHRMETLSSVAKKS